MKIVIADLNESDRGRKVQTNELYGPLPIEGVLMGWNSDSIRVDLGLRDVCFRGPETLAVEFV